MKQFRIVLSWNRSQRKAWWPARNSVQAELFAPPIWLISQDATSSRPSGHTCSWQSRQSVFHISIILWVPLFSCLSARCINLYLTLQSQTNALHWHQAKGLNIWELHNCAGKCREGFGASKPKAKRHAGISIHVRRVSFLSSCWMTYVSCQSHTTGLKPSKNSSGSSSHSRR